jgi:hypothetical protein
MLIADRDVRIIDAAPANCCALLLSTRDYGRLGTTGTATATPAMTRTKEGFASSGMS